MTDENALEDEAYELNAIYSRVPYIPTEDDGDFLPLSKVVG